MPGPIITKIQLINTLGLIIYLTVKATVILQLTEYPFLRFELSIKLRHTYIF